MFKFIVLAAALASAHAAINPSNCGKPAIAPKECNTGCLKADQDMLAEFYRIVGGMEAKQGSWPWQIQFKKNGYPHCGGSIVNANTIVTAAHCFKSTDTKIYKAHAASHRKTSTDKNEKIYSIKSILNHPKYSSRSKDNDVSIVKISGTFDYNDYISPVCVASSDPKDNSMVFVTGFGATKGTGKDGLLKQTMKPIVSRSTCNKKYSGRITSSMLCAGYPKGGHDACQGDSGGPLVQKVGGKWTLQGIVSWGIGCAEAKHPGVYASVAKALSWIKSNS